MNEQIKHGLEKLLQEAIRSLDVHELFGESLPLPVNVYSRYMKECWKYFGLDCFYRY